MFLRRTLPADQQPPVVFRFSRSFDPGTIYVGIDPGKTNMALCATRHRRNGFEILYADMLSPHLLIRDFEGADTEQRIRIFTEHMEAFLLRWRPRRVVIELFFMRGFRTNLGTYINFMVGIVASLCVKNGIAVLPVNAGTWKGKAWLKTKTTDAALYQFHPVAHLVDSFLMSLYAEPTCLERLSLPALQTLVQSLPQPETSTRLKAPVKRKKRVKSSKKKSEPKSPRSKTKRSPSARSATSNSSGRARSRTAPATE